MIFLDNPLITPVERILTTGSGVTLSEHQLIGLLKEYGALDSNAISDSVGLFQVHFLVMNALYQLRPVLWEQGLKLSISSLEIAVTEIDEGEGGEGEGNRRVALNEVDLSDYYLCWSNFEGVTTDSVNALLDKFWQRYIAQDDRERALRVLGLPTDCLYQDVRKRYRQLTMEAHPDRGGSDDAVAQLNEAMAILKRCSFPDRR